eukprot:CAMPEP_0114487762 /NCGR_PEP_ID=MMETSP0109-20121206/948_1 /TAXON_ID=29199 /ORGANISM="Chlorarachnion reptans, Strain CCCM449" /LENGTH=265 /DNA_ID=CAMNT_0001664067 /DNA_START=261 /DNA_END=1055 /DNA_ORIENTATION=+
MAQSAASSPTHRRSPATECPMALVALKVERILSADKAEEPSLTPPSPKAVAPNPVLRAVLFLAPAQDRDSVRYRSVSVSVRVGDHPPGVVLEALAVGPEEAGDRAARVDLLHHRILPHDRPELVHAEGRGLARGQERARAESVAVPAQALGAVQLRPVREVLSRVRDAGEVGDRGAVDELVGLYRRASVARSRVGGAVEEGLRGEVQVRKRPLRCDRVAIREGPDGAKRPARAAHPREVLGLGRGRIFDAVHHAPVEGPWEVAGR